MRHRLLASALLLYLVLDFGNPLMPGAVSFVSGELDTVEGAEHRAPETPVPIIGPTPPVEIEFRLEGHEPARLEVRASLRPRPRFAARSRPSASSGDSTTSPDDD